MIEFFKPEKNNEGKVSHEEEKLSRREFLKRGMALGAAGILEWYAPLEEKRALSKEVKAGDSWLGGLKALHDDALFANDESIALYRKNKDGIGSWAHYTEGRTPILFSEDVFREELGKKPKEIKLVHTHPIAQFSSYEIFSSELMTNIRDGKQAPPSMPPSIEDIFSDIESNTIVQKHEDTVFVSGVIDPRGLWEFSRDENHEFVKLASFLYKAMRFVENPTIIALLKSGNLNLLSKKEQAYIEKAYETEKILYEKYTDALVRLQNAGNQFVKRSLGGETPDMDPLLKVYADVGYVVSFKTVEELKTVEEGEG